MPEFHEYWFRERSCRTLAGLVREVAGVSGRIIEVGSWEGRSTLVIAEATSRTVHAVDHWQGSPSDESFELAQQRDVYAQFLANIEGHDVKPFKMDWRDYHAANTMPIALVFLDAMHTYDEVTAQIQAFRPLLSPGGIICGDDWTHDPVMDAVVDQFTNVSYDGAVWWWRNA